MFLITPSTMTYLRYDLYPLLLMWQKQIILRFYARSLNHKNPFINDASSLYFPDNPLIVIVNNVETFN